MDHQRSLQSVAQALALDDGGGVDVLQQIQIFIGAHRRCASNSRSGALVKRALKSAMKCGANALAASLEVGPRGFEVREGRLGRHEVQRHISRLAASSINMPGTGRRLCDISIRAKRDITIWDLHHLGTQCVLC